jgi:hypothetical protein
MLIPGLELHQLPLRRLYCGPAAICAITGLDYETVVRPAINRRRGQAANRGVLGMSYKHAIDTLADLGWGWVALLEDGHDRPTLRRFLERAPPDLTLLVHVTSHFVTAHRLTVVDNHRIARWQDHPARRRQVRHAWWVFKQQGGGDAGLQGPRPSG